MEYNQTEIERRKGPDIVVKSLAFYFLLMPFDSFPVFGMGSLLKIVAILPLFAVLVLHRKKTLRINRLTSVFIIYVIVNAITCIYSVDTAASLFELRRLLMNGLLIIVVGGMYTQYTKEDLQYLTKALILGGLATVALTLIFSDSSLTGRLTLMINGSRQDQNYINGYMYFAYAFFMNRMIRERKVLFLIPVAGLTLFTLMTGSRGATLALIALGLMVFIYNMFNEGRIRFRIMIISLIAMMCFFIGFDYIMMLLPSSVARRFNFNFIVDNTGTSRGALWLSLLKTYKESNVFRQFFGHGYGAVYTVNTYNHLVAHNLWLDHLISGGIVGLALLIYMNVVFVKEAWKQKDVVIFSTYMGYLAMCFTLSLTNYKPLWNCMIMIMVLHYSNLNEKQKKDSDEDYSTRESDNL